MLVLVLIEWLVLVEIVFFDRAGEPLRSGEGFLGPYFLLCTGSLVLQAAGVLFVLAGRYRLGGVLQIVSSSLHVPKGEGLIGVVGGAKAYRYPARLDALQPDGA